MLKFSNDFSARPGPGDQVLVTGFGDSVGIHGSVWFSLGEIGRRQHLEFGWGLHLLPVHQHIEALEKALGKLLALRDKAMAEKASQDPNGTAVGVEAVQS